MCPVYECSAGSRKQLSGNSPSGAKAVPGMTAWGTTFLGSELLELLDSLRGDLASASFDSKLL